MNKCSKLVGVTALSMTMAVPAFADVTTPVNSQPTPNDLAYAFGDNSNLQAKAMTGQEMNDTQGAWVANAIGGLAGMYGAGYGAAAMGGALGFASPVNGVRSGLTTLGTSFASTYVPTKFGGKYW